MDEFKNRKVVVIGLDASGSAACELLQRAGASVIAVSVASENPSQKRTPYHLPQRVTVVSGDQLPESIDVAVHSSQIGRQHPVILQLIEKGVPVISDLELSSKNLFCLSVAITGTNGKTTTAELVASMLEGAQRSEFLDITKVHG